MTDPKLAEIILQHSSPLEPVATEATPHVECLDGLRAVLFDVYGTLVISASGDIGANSGDHRQDALLRTCEQFGLTLDGTAAAGVEEFFAAIGASHQSARDLGIEHPEVDIVEIWQSVLPKMSRESTENVDFRRFAVEYEVRVNPVWPMPSAAETLTKLADRDFVLGVVSNAQFFTPLLFPTLLGKDLEGFGFSPQLLYFSYEHRQAKPGNFLYHQASEQLQSQGVPPEQVLYVGNDMLNDVAAAASVGFRTALFAGDQRSLRLREDDRRVDGVRPDLRITQLSQLLECVGK